jgi:hypothetical protein
MNKPFRFASDGEVPAPLPHDMVPPTKLPDDSERNSDGTMHSPSIKWPVAGGLDDAAKPFKSLR